MSLARREARARERHRHEVVDSLEALDPDRPIREADINGGRRHVRYVPLPDSPIYSMISSAVASSDSGAINPRALAVLRLTMSENFVGSWIGRSAAFSPLRMRWTYAAAWRYWKTRSAPYETNTPTFHARLRSALRCNHYASAASNALASFRSIVSKPSVNQPYGSEQFKCQLMLPLVPP